MNHTRRGRTGAAPVGAKLLALVLALVAGASADSDGFESGGQTQPPIFHQHNDILHFSVHEDANLSTVVGNIRASSGDVPSMLVPWETDKQPLTSDEEINRIFALNQQTGDISLRAKLDREQREHYFFLGIVMSPFIEVKCTVRVLDVNDEAPRFLLTRNESAFVVEMPEGQRGLRRSLPLAVDNDSPQNGIKEFRITSGNTPINMFTLVEHEAPARSALQGAAGEDAAAMIVGDNPQLMQQFAQQATVLIPSQPAMQAPVGQPPAVILAQHPALQYAQPAQPLSKATSQAAGSQTKFHIDLEVSQPLDRENQSSYQLVIEAIDGGTTPLVGRLMVTVLVTDINDNDPVFKPSKSEFFLKEDAATGTFVHRVQAHDADLDANGQVSYFIKRLPSASQPYGPNATSDSGDLGVRYQPAGAKLRQPQPMALTSPPASGGGGSGKLMPRNSQQTSLAGSGNELAEGQPAETVSGAYKPRQSYGAGPTDQLFEIDSAKGDIYLVHPLDYESEPSHELLIEARDHGKPSRSAFMSIKILVINVDDDLPSNRASDRVPSAPQSESPKSESRLAHDPSDFASNYLQSLNMVNWFAHINSSLLFVMILVVLFAVAFSVCLVKIKSRQPESDYNDTDGLNPNSGQTKPSPNHSTSNEHSNGSQDSHHRHHAHQRRGVDNSFGGLNGTGSSFGSPNGKFRYQPIDSSNLYHNPYPQLQSRHPSGHLQQAADSPTDHQMANGVGLGGSAAGTMTLHSHHAALLASASGHHSLEHHHSHHHQFPNALGQGHHTSSLTYAHHHSRAALLHQAHHHQSSHHLSTVHHGHHNKGGTMNSLGTHHSAHPSASPLPETPNTTHSSGMPANMHESHHHGSGIQHGHLNHNSLLPLHHSSSSSAQQTQLPNSPCNAPAGIFSAWPQAPGSSVGGCYPSAQGPLHRSPSECNAPTSSQLPDRWFDHPGMSPAQLNCAQDYYGSYNHGYLADWLPDHMTIMQLVDSEASGH